MLVEALRVLDRAPTTQRPEALLARSLLLPESGRQGSVLPLLFDGALRVVELAHHEGGVLLVLRAADPHEKRLGLSHQERRVLVGLVDGRSQKETAFDLGLCPTTVSAHVHRAVAKLGVERWERAVTVVAMSLHEAPRAPEHEDATVVCLRRTFADGALGSLSKAEREIVLSVADGQSNASIADVRGTSGRTVANQIASAFRKLGVKSRLGLILHLLEACGPPVSGPTVSAPEFSGGL